VVLGGRALRASFIPIGHDQLLPLKVIFDKRRLSMAFTEVGSRGESGNRTHEGNRFDQSLYNSRPTC
jgi:hypothetical protein